MPFSRIKAPEMEEEWDLVIKVNYGDTLRRISSYVNGRYMDHDMSKLRAKIIELFKFSPDADLILTYTDEDGDVVTLDDDGDLSDAAISQHLNPLRINVQLKNNTTKSANTKSQTLTSTLIGSPLTESQPPQINSAVDEALKAVPEPFRSALLKLSHDLIFDVAYSAPAFAEFVEYFSTLGLSNASQPSHGPNVESLGTSNGASTHPKDLKVSEGPKVSNDLVPVPKVLPSANPVNPVLEHVSKQHDNGNMTQGVGTTAPTSEDHHLDVPRNPRASGFPSINELLTLDKLELEKEGGDSYGEGKSVAVAAPISMPPADQTVGRSSSQKVKKSKPPPYTFGTGLFDGSSSKQFPIGTGPATSHVGFDSQGGVPMNSAYAPTLNFSPGNIPIRHPYRRAHGHHDSTPRTFHRGVRCDGCGMHPIMGPRFKSNVKEDYDLCIICFSEMGNEADYTRIDRAPYRSPRLFKEFYNPHSAGLPSSHAFHGYGTRPAKAKFDSSFIQDITVLDETLMAPCTPFTKIWRMRNNGTVAWPFGTKLVWIDGCQFGDKGSVELEIPVNGWPVDKDIDIAVDLTAPLRPDKYISYWQMESPYGQKFGQRVWVLIQVENFRPSSVADSIHADFNLNLPPKSSGLNEVGIIDMNADPLDDVGPSERNYNNATEELVKALANEILNKEVQPAQVDNVLGATCGLGQTMPMPLASYPIIDFPTSSSHVPPLAVAPPSGAAINDNPVEETLLKELEEMGFEQFDLNKEILRLNEYDLEQSVEDLCGFAGLDPMLEELEEMGFCDREMNRKLLIENGGSIKRVVLDLITGEKAE